MPCHDHPRSAAHRRCLKCERTWCDACVVSPVGMPSVKMCPMCRDMAVPFGRRGDEQAGSFFSDLVTAFTYPFRGNGWVTLFTGALFLWVIYLLSTVSIFGGIGLMLGLGITTAYMMRVISSSSDGDEQLPDWEEMTDVWSAIVVPLVQIWLLAILCFGPAAALWVLVSPQVAFVAGVVGAIYFPMAWIAVALHQSISAATPSRVFGAILQAPLHYVVACLAYLAVGTGSAMAAGMLGEAGILGSAFAYGMSLYLNIVSMRILGRLYFRNADRFDWFGEATGWR